MQKTGEVGGNRTFYLYAIQSVSLADRGEERIIRRDDAPSAAPQGSTSPTMRGIKQRFGACR